MIHQCHYCQDFYRIDDDASPIDTELTGEGHSLSTHDGWGADICHQCADEINRTQDELDSAWKPDFYRQYEEER